MTRLTSSSRLHCALALCSAAFPMALACASGGVQVDGRPVPAPAVAQPDNAKPIDEKLANVKMGMSDSDVRSLLGEPTRSGSYPTWKNWVPFAGMGGDTMRTDYVYRGLGKVVFSRNAYTQRLKVVAVVPE